MNDFILMGDAGCDLDPQFLEEYDIKMINGHVVLPNEGDIPSFNKWERISREDFYSSLKKNPSAYSTSPANVTEYKNFFEQYVKDGKSIICVTISRAVSGSIGFAETARANVLKKYPNADIRIIDSMRFGPGIGLMLINAAALKNAGKSIDETAAFLENNKNRFHQAGWLDDLSFVAKKGRINHPQAFFGTLAGIKPIGEFDSEGLTTVLGKAKGAKAAYSVLLKYIDATVENPEDQIFFIAQSNRMAQAQQYKQMLEDRFHPKKIYIKDVFPFCGVNVGPGLMAAYYMGKPISKDLSEERALIERFLSEK